MLTNVNPLLQPEGVRKLSDVLRGYQKGTLAQHGSTRNNLITFKK